MKIFITLTLACFSCLMMNAQDGCTDEMAVNYDESAVSDDDSCVYDNDELSIDLVSVATGFSSPVDIVNAGDDRMFIVEQDGTIKILNSDFTTVSDDFLDIDSQVGSGGEQGLLGMAFHPDYANNGYFYVHYTKNNGDSRVSRFTVSSDPDIADPDSELVILEQDQPFSNHNAGDLAFGPDGYLYIPYGDGGSGEDPLDAGQSTDTWLGKMLRIDVDGDEPYEVPADNPFVNNSDYLPEIWATGLRNTWRIAFDAETGDLWMGDVGQYQWEEIDIELAGDPGGHNYGWRCYEGNHEFNNGSSCPSEINLTFPVFEFNHSGGACSVTGGCVYRGSNYENLQGIYICTDYCSGDFYGVDYNDGLPQDYELLPGQGFGWSTFGEDSNLEMYVAKLNGTIYHIQDACANDEATLTITDGVLEAESGDAYAWYMNGNLIPGENNQEYTPTEFGTFQVFVQNDGECSSFSNEIMIVSTEEFDLQDIEIFPNPVKDQATLTFPETMEVSSVQILDIMGKVVIEKSYKKSNNVIDLSTLTVGNYFLKFDSNYGTFSKKFIKE